MPFVNSKRGFTVVELLVVIAVVSLLSSVVFATSSGMRERSRDRRLLSDIKQIQTALELYYNSNNNYPSGLYGVGATNGLTNGGYMPAVPYQPKGASIPYRYAYCTAPGTWLYYHLGGSLEGNEAAIMNTDRDCISSGLTPDCASPSSLCTAYSGGFPGADSGKCNAADAGNRCYDVVP